MDTFTKQALNNLKILRRLKEKDILISNTTELKLQDEYVQIDNYIELEYAIYFTFHQLFSSNNESLIYNHDIIKDLDKCIDNIYENDQLSEKLTEHKHFHLILRNIDTKLEDLKEKVFYESPFFRFFQMKYNLFESIQTLLKENKECCFCYFRGEWNER